MIILILAIHFKYEVVLLDIGTSGFKNDSDADLGLPTVLIAQSVV